MANLIQLFRDFRDWREERCRKRLVAASYAINRPKTHLEPELCWRMGASETEIWRKGVLYGIIHRKEVLKQAKI